MAATLTIPDQTTPYPAVILISGSGANDRNEDIMMHQPFAVIADYLSHRRGKRPELAGPVRLQPAKGDKE